MKILLVAFFFISAGCSSGPDGSADSRSYQATAGNSQNQNSQDQYSQQPVTPVTDLNAISGYDNSSTSGYSDSSSYNQYDSSSYNQSSNSNDDYNSNSSSDYQDHDNSSEQESCADADDPVACQQGTSSQSQNQEEQVNYDCDMATLKEIKIELLGNIVKSKSLGDLDEKKLAPSSDGTCEEIEFDFGGVQVTMDTNEVNPFYESYSKIEFYDETFEDIAQLKIRKKAQCFENEKSCKKKWILFGEECIYKVSELSIFEFSGYKVFINDDFVYEKNNVDFTLDSEQMDFVDDSFLDAVESYTSTCSAGVGTKVKKYDEEGYMEGVDDSPRGRNYQSLDSGDDEYQDPEDQDPPPRADNDFSDFSAD